jgi:uncharacterized membrane protein YjgN (DUF898 family)
MDTSAGSRFPTQLIGPALTPAPTPPSVEPTSAPQSAPLAPLPFSFTGNGKEYFGIWSINLLLTIVTLGIYSAWAKVRRLKYFHRNTFVANANFDYHGTPKAILIGRVVAVGLLLLYKFSSNMPVLWVIMIVVLAALLPWMIRRSLIFRAHNTSYRAIRFRFSGSLPDAYKVYLGGMLAVMASLGTLAPFVRQRMTRYQLNHTALGRTPFTFHGTAGAFYKPFMVTIGLMFAVIVVLGAVATTITMQSGALKENAVFLSVLIAPIYLLAFWVTRAYFSAHMQNLVWNNTTLGPHRFTSNAQVLPLFRIMAKNALFTVLTLGLYRPYAVVNTMRYQIGSMALIPGAPIESFLAQASADVNAIGAEAADLFDFDVSL